MADIQSAIAEIRRGKKNNREKKETTGQKYTVSTKTRPLSMFKIFFKISKLCAITISQHEYLSIFNKTANFSESLSYRH